MKKNDELRGETCVAPHGSSKDHECTLEVWRVKWNSN